MLNLTFGEQVKIVLSRKNMTIKELAEEIEIKTGKKMSRQNLTQRLGRDNFQEQDMRMIAEILECPLQLNILSDEDRHGDISESIYALDPSDEINEKKKRGKIIFLEPQTDLFQRIDELSTSEHDITIGELVDIHEQLEKLEQDKKADQQGEMGVLEYEVPGTKEAENTEDGETNTEEENIETAEIVVEVIEKPEAAAETVHSEPEVLEEGMEYEAHPLEEVDEEKPEEEKAEQGKLHLEEPQIEQEEGEQAMDAVAMVDKTESIEYQEQQPEVSLEDATTEHTTKSEEEKVPEELPVIQSEQKQVRKNPFTSVLKGYIRKKSKPAARDLHESQMEKDAVKGEPQVIDEPVEEETQQAEENVKESEIHEDTAEALSDEPEEAALVQEREPQMMANGVGEVNPCTGREYETNSVRMHPNRIGYIQVYDRGEHQWEDMTEWAFLGYQERKKALLGDKYEAPIYLD